MIVIDDLHKSFGAHHVLRGISFRVQRGSVRVILGVSGSGKTVMMKHMIGLLRPDQGRVLVDGQDLSQLKDAELMQVRKKFGMVFQQAALFDSMTVGDNVAFPLREHTRLSKPEIEKLVKEKLAIVDLHDVEGRYPAELSGGMRKRVGLARAIVLQPECVLYDEPTTGLDPLTTESVNEMIIATKQRLNVTSVVISHDIGSALKVADQIAILHQGELIEDGPPAQIRASAHPFVQRFLNTWFEKN